MCIISAGFFQYRRDEEYISEHTLKPVSNKEVGVTMMVILYVGNIITCITVSSYLMYLLAHFSATLDFSIS